MSADQHRENIPYEDVKREEQTNTDSSSSAKRLIAIFAAAMAFYHLYVAATGIPPAMKHRSFHLLFALILVFLSHPFSGSRPLVSRIVDFCLIICSILSVGYIVVNFTSVLEHVYNIDPITPTMTIMGIMGMLAVIEATRRVVGPPLALIALISIVYVFVGPYLPAAFAHQGVNFDLFIDHMYMTTEGIFGPVLGVSSTFVILFVILGSFLQESGAGVFFIDVAYSLLGWTRGGPAKVAAFASSLVGTISGSAVANVGTSGPLTIPLMKKVGYRPKYAGAIECVASVGGQIMPPIMGAAAFIMSDFLGTPYIKVCVAAAIPAILYYWALFMMVDLEAAKNGLKGLPRKELPKFWTVIRDGWQFAVPILVVLYLLAVVQYSPMLTAFWGVVANIALSWIKPRKAMGGSKIFSALEKGAKGSLQVALACACVGIVMGALTVTGLGLRLSSILTSWAQGNYFLLLFLTMIASLILGASLPTTPTYLFLAITVAPALISLGMLPMAAHLFVFYFGAISDMTPPLAISGYIAAGIAGANPLRTTFLACRIGVAGFIIPFMFAYSPGYILSGNWLQILMQIIPGVVGIAALAAALTGYLLIRLHLMMRVILFAAASLLIFPGMMTSLAGFALIAIVIGQQSIGKRKGLLLQSL